MGQQEARFQWKGSRWKFGLVTYFRILCWKSLLTHYSHHSNSQFHLHSNPCFLLRAWAKLYFDSLIFTLNHDSLCWQRGSQLLWQQGRQWTAVLVCWYLNYRRTLVLTPSNFTVAVSAAALVSHPAVSRRSSNGIPPILTRKWKANNFLSSF